MVHLNGDQVVGSKGCTWGINHLIAQELEMDFEMKEEKKLQDHGDGQSFFVCNICLEMASEPVITCCGHLFCWPCFAELPYVDLATKAKECLVCGGEVSDSDLIPIYGSAGKSIGKSGLKSDVSIMIPPRPNAKRVERVEKPPVPRVAAVEVLQAESSAGVNINSATNSQNLPESTDVFAVLDAIVERCMASSRKLVQDN